MVRRREGGQDLRGDAECPSAGVRENKERMAIFYRQLPKVKVWCMAYKQYQTAANERGANVTSPSLSF